MSKSCLKKNRSKLEEELASQLHLAGLPIPESEYLFFSPHRKWRFDFAYPKLKIAIECEGGVWNAGRHTRGAGFIADTEKYNIANLLGWRVLRFTRESIENGVALQFIQIAFEGDHNLVANRLGYV